MGKNTSIEWTDHSFSPWWGCVKVSPGCTNCYALAFDRRTFGTARHVTAKGETREPHWGKDAPRRFFGDKHWAEPLKWNRAAERDGVRRRAFCASMADVFEDRPDLLASRRRLFDLILATPALDWLLLTKRPENVERLWLAPYDEDRMPPNVWMGTTCEDQARADERIPQLLRVPAAVRFLSVEPLLGPVDLRAFPPFLAAHGAAAVECPHGFDQCPKCDRGIDWVIVGGESGPRARPCDVAWVRSVVSACRVSGVPCFVKQVGSNAHDSSGKQFGWGTCRTPTRNPKGGDPAEWPEDLRVRQVPEVGP